MTVKSPGNGSMVAVRAHHWCRLLHLLKPDGVTLDYIPRDVEGELRRIGYWEDFSQLAESRPTDEAIELLLDAVRADRDHDDPDMSLPSWLDDQDIVNMLVDDNDPLEGDADRIPPDLRSLFSVLDEGGDEIDVVIWYD